jgi:hypothetical protein
MATVLHKAAKSCTALLLDHDTTTINVDLGPERQNLTNAGTYLSEANSARTALNAPRNLTVVLNMRSTDSNVILQLGNAGTYSYRVSLAASVVSVAEAGVVRTSATMPGLVAGFRKCLIHWSQRLEGASVVSELALYNFVSATWAFSTATHAAATPVATDTLTVAAATSGASTYTGALSAITAVHIGRRFRSTTETAGDWVGDPAAPTITGLHRMPMLTGASTDLAIAGEGSFAGPSILMAAAATRKADSRAVGGFVNVLPTTPVTELVSPSPTRFYRATPDGVAGWQLCFRYLFHGYLSPKVNSARVRIHVRAYDTLGGGGTISPCRFRSFSLAHLPVGVPNQPDMTFSRGPIASIITPSATGVWLDLGICKLVREPSGLSYFALGFSIESAVNEGVTFSTGWLLNAITVDPFAADLSSGGFGDFDKEGG